MLHKHLLSDWRTDLPFSSITSACLFSLRTGYVLALEAQLVTKDNEMTPKSPTCFYSCGWDLRQQLFPGWALMFYPRGLRFFLSPAFHGRAPTEVTWHLLLGVMALTALVISPLFFCVDSCVMLGCHDNWLISIQFLDWETRSHKELQMMPDCLLPIAWLLPFSGR